MVNITIIMSIGYAVYRDGEEGAKAILKLQAGIQCLDLGVLEYWSIGVF